MTRDRDALKTKLKHEKLLLVKTMRKKKTFSKETEVDAHAYELPEDNQLLRQPIGQEAHPASVNPHKAKDILFIQ